ncbi:MAG: FtsQ-type POTRA domain-containing protein [Ruminococcaceae bacterium]|nr:FtsQ-type POTRA domain-containing protein [Oscillospiraceae bacterium]
MNQSNNRRESRFFTGNQSELQQIKSKESLQKFVRHNRAKKQLSRFGYTVVFIAICVVFIIICLAVFFKIKTIEVVGTTRYSAEQVLSVVDIEEGLSLYEVSNRDVQAIPKKLAYIHSARIVRKLPSTLVISVIEDTPVYVSEFYGEFFILSEELRVLDRVFDRAELEGMTLVELVLPTINSAVVGETVEFEADVTRRYVEAYLDALEGSDLFAKTTAFDLRDRFNLAVICEGIYLVDFGNGDELGTKFTAVAGMLENEVFADKIPATIDANDPTECAVIKDPGAEIAFN